MGRILLYIFSVVALLLTLAYRLQLSSSSKQRVGPKLGLIGRSLQKKQPLADKTLLALAQGEIFLGSTKKARQWLKKCKEPKSEKAQVLLVQSYHLDGNELKSALVIDEALQKYPKSEKLHALKIDQLKNEPRKLLEYLQVIEEKMKSSPALYLRLSYRLEGQKAWSALSDVLGSAGISFPNNRTFSQYKSRIDQFIKNRAPKIEQVALAVESVAETEVTSFPDKVTKTVKTLAANSKPRFPSVFPRPSYRGPKTKRVTKKLIERLVKNGYLGMSAHQLRTLVGPPTKRMGSSHPTSGLFAHIPRPERWDYVATDGKNGVVVQLINGKVTAIGPYVRRSK